MCRELSDNYFISLQNPQLLNTFKSLLIVHCLIEHNALLGDLLKACFHLDASDLALNLQYYRKTKSFLSKLCYWRSYYFGILEKIHCVVLRNGYEQNVILWISLSMFMQRMYALVQVVWISEDLSMDFTNDFLVLALISLYADACNVHLLDATKLFEAVLDKNAAALNAMILAYMHNQIVCFSESFHACALKQGSENHTSMLTDLVSVYNELREASQLRKLREWSFGPFRLQDMSVYAFAIRTGFIQETLLTSLMFMSCAQLKNLNLAICAMIYMVHTGFDKDIAISNALTDLYARFGKII
ncbi:uncharacterized protein LOC126681486 [Mercurialis annua]|uniref:uncharacterized protein LOC126681486 n=1 Tax=Mercurialis annua TaxID=3986 RepID=UPI00215F04EE|nr:uncharacterized protein LOC126681486 [Mercurialis annua]